MISFIVPGAPVPKGRPRFAKRGNFVTTYTPEKTASYENLVKVLAMQAMAGKSIVDKSVTVEIQINISPPASWSQKKRKQALDGDTHPAGRFDLDNIAKAVLDAMNGVVYADDKQVVVLLVEKFYHHESFVWVSVREGKVVYKEFIT